MRSVRLNIIMKIITTVIAVAFLIVSSTASAGCLKDNPSVKQEYADSLIVFVGKVIAKKDVAESRDYYEGDEYTVQVQDIFKGLPTNPIIIYSENSSGRFPMSVGEEYVLFVYYNLGRYQIDNCGNSGLLCENQATAKSAWQLRKPVIQ